MWKKSIFNQKKKKLSKDRGFITIEIIIALLIAFGFLMVSLQTLVAAMVFKVQAQEKQKADKLIQEDLERLNDIASNLTLGANGTEACDGDLNNDGTVGDGYGQNLWTALQTNTPDGDDKLKVSLISVVKQNGSTTETKEIGKTLTLNRTQVAVPNTAIATPHRVLGVSYQVNDDTGKTIAQRYIEVIPDEALECP